MLATGATVGIALGAAALFLGAIALFVVYYLRQKKWEREDKAPLQPFAAAQQFYYGKDPGSGGPASVTTTSNHSYALPPYAADYKPPQQVGGAAVSVPETPEPLPSDYSSNAEYYDRLEGKTRGRPLRTISPPMQIAAVNNNNHHEQVDTIGQLPTNSLPTHPAYIPRSSSSRNSSRATPQPGARPSRNPTPTSVRSSTQSAPLRPQHNSTSTSTTNSGSGGAKPDSYAIQVYLNAAEDPKVPQPPPPVAAPSWSSSHPPPPRATAPASNAEIARNIQVELASAQPTPPTSAASLPQVVGGRSTPAPSLQSQHISRAASPDYAAGEGSPLPPPPRIGSLILPSVPRIRVPGSKKLPPRLDVPDGAGADISGPLAFPDSRFSTRPPPPPGQGQGQAQGQGQDRIITQTVDRVGRSVEMPIGSGKSYLYG